MAEKLPAFEFQIEVVDRATGHSTPTLIDADSQDEARESISRKTGQLVGEVRKIGTSAALRNQARNQIERDRRLDNPAMTASEIKAKNRFIGFAVLLAINGVAFVIWGQVSFFQTEQLIRKVERNQFAPTWTRILEDRFKSDNAIGATANSMEAFLSDFRAATEVANSNTGIVNSNIVIANSNIRTFAYSVYAAASFVLSMLCVIGASLVKLRATIRLAGGQREV